MQNKMINLNWAGELKKIFMDMVVNVVEIWLILKYLKLKSVENMKI